MLEPKELGRVDLNSRNSTAPLSATSLAERGGARKGQSRLCARGFQVRNCQQVPERSSRSWRLCVRGIEQRALIGGIRNAGAADESEGSELVFLWFGGADDFEDADAADEESVRDERAMAAPWDGLGAHQHRGRLFLREVDGAIKRFGECGHLHVVGI